MKNKKLLYYCSTDILRNIKYESEHKAEKVQEVSLINLSCGCQSVHECDW